jgi:uncharacterized protein YbcI
MNTLKTQGEVEAQISTNLSKLYTDLFNRGPKHIQVSMLPSAAVVLVQNTFTAAEQQIMQHGKLFDESGRKMFKNMRSHVMAANREALTTVVEGATGVVVSSVHHDVSTITGEEAFVFSLRSRPEYRPNHNANGRSRMAMT